MRYPIRIVSRRTGLSPHVIRVWEKRYGAVKPERSGTNRRLYAEAEIERLRLLRVATAAGHAIGNIARLPTQALQELVARPEESGVGRSRLKRGGVPKAGDYVEDALRAIERHDGLGLESVLTRAAVSLGHRGLLQQVVGPLTQKVGDLWREGGLTAAHEHFATATMRTFLGSWARPFALSDHAPVLVVGTPAGQLHEMGAVMVAAAAADLGWRVVYLGTSLPAAELAGAAVRCQARALALSIVYPEDDPHLAEELEHLRRCLPAEVTLIVGGRAAAGYAGVLEQNGAMLVDDLRGLSGVLERLRTRAP